MKTNNTNLGLFLLLSVGLHVLLIAAWHTDTDNNVAVNEATSSIQLQLAVATSQLAKINKTITTKQQHRPVSEQKPAKKQTMASKSTSRQTPPLARQAARSRQPAAAPSPVNDMSTEPSPMPPTQQVSSMPSAPATPEQQLQLGTRIQKQLHVKIAFNRHYPGMAIRNAWEGQVNLGIRVQANGNLTNIHIINSSGYNILDRAAINSVRHVATLPEASRWLQGQTIDVILPVIYKLTDS